MLTTGCRQCPVSACGRRDDPEHYRVPEFLVGMGFRCWLASQASGDPEWRQRCERYYAASLPDEHRPCVVAQLGSWLASIRSSARRSFRLHEMRRPHFSADEALAIAMVAAAQYGAGSELWRLTQMLTGAAEPACVVAATELFGGSLLRAGQELRRRSMQVGQVGGIG